MFLEGRTELEFNCKLIEVLANQQRVEIDLRKVRGSMAVRQPTTQIRSHQIGDPTEPSGHSILMLDCGNDELVKRRMRKEYKWLVAGGYTKIICHRDVRATEAAGAFLAGRELTHADLPRLEFHLPLGVGTKIPVTFILSVMEVEAWFLAEHSHFAKIDPAITLDEIRTKLGFDPSTDDLQLRQYPADDLNACYGLGGKAYDKFLSQTTIDALDYEAIYLEVAERFPHLRKLCDEIESFLAMPVLALLAAAIVPYLSAIRV